MRSVVVGLEYGNGKGRPFSPGGLYVSLCNMQGFGEDFLQLAVERGAGALYLHQSWKRVPKASATEESSAMDTSSDTVRASKHKLEQVHAGFRNF